MASFPFVADDTVVRQSVTFRDAKGNTSTVRFFCGGTVDTLDHFVADIQTFITALAALSNAAIQSKNGLVTEYGVAQYGAHTTGGAYESIIEKAQLVFQDNAGTLHRWEIPAPKIAIFKADKVTVDPANSLVATFFPLVVGPGANGMKVVSRQNIPMANYMGGIFKSRKIRRRLNILVLEPDLTGSLPAE